MAALVPPVIRKGEGDAKTRYSKQLTFVRHPSCVVAAAVSRTASGAGRRSKRKIDWQDGPTVGKLGTSRKLRFQKGIDSRARTAPAVSGTYSESSDGGELGV